MKKNQTLRLLLMGALLMVSATHKTSAQTLAFPEAEGFAAYATGGRGGTVYHVTNLNKSGAGSLADAVSQPNRFVVFDVAGVIDITNSSITISSNVTIAGQTAPGEGISIYGGRVIASKSKNIIIRYMRMYGGKSIDRSKCTLTLDNCQNVIMDHCTVAWGPWDNVHITDATDITWQNCIIAEGIEPQRFGAITDGTRRWTIAHCLWINNKSRNPKMKCYLQYYNNVVYNFGMGIIGGHSSADNYQDVMNNYFIAGPNGSAKYFDDWTETDHLYSTGNYFDGNCDGVLNGTLITDHHSATPMSTPVYGVINPRKLLSARESYDDIVEQVGASKMRDVHERRYLSHLTSLGRLGAFLTNEDDVGGIGTINPGMPIVDTDRDGMSDEWEIENGLDPLKNDASNYNFGNGYTNIENYANGQTKQTFTLMYPTDVKAELVTSVNVLISWTNTEPTAQEVVVEMSEDGKNYTEAKRVDISKTSCNIRPIQSGKLYYFRLKNICTDGESPYSTVVRVNDEFMLPGGGTKGNQRYFTPVEGKAYRILNYSTVSYNSAANIDGTPKYLKLLESDGRLGAEEFNYSWDDESLLWLITKTDDGYEFKHLATGRYLHAFNQTFSDGERIGSSLTPSNLTITYVGNQTPAQSGTTKPLSFYRINSPSNGDQQIRARVFANDWIWGSGTLTRADMIFTFVEADNPFATPTAVQSVPATSSARYYTLQGVLLQQQPHHGLFIEQRSNADGSTIVRKVMMK